MKLTYVVVFLLILLTFKSVGARAVRKSCGKYLADRISDLCKARGGYSQLTSADSEQRSHRRIKRGIVEECCHQQCCEYSLSCTDTILMQYCMEQVEQPEEVVMSNEESKSTTPPTTARTVEQLPFTTRFPFNAMPMEFGTVRPEFNRINAKYMGSRRKQYYRFN
ncbi:bombyxin B-1 homolog isoform X1 [Aedes albopictus]|uniref:Insulin-like domain-containing protein n=1 Tax=Aedes albopictus TaxID=7160 RepID=A0ABM1Z1U4_AEDAL